MHVKSILTAAVLTLVMAGTAARADNPAELSDLEIAHVAYTADLIDIRYAHLALAISKNEDVRAFATTMINDHSHVNHQAEALLKQLGAAPVDNFLSRQLNAQADQLVAELSQLSGAAFDKRYAENELAYHQAVNGLVEITFIPNIDNAQVRALFEDAIGIFKAHEGAAGALVEDVRVQVTGTMQAR